MARLARLVVPGQAHYVLQRGHNGGAIVGDDDDRTALLATLRDAMRSEDCLLHGYALGTTELHLLVTPPTAAALSRAMQSLGRRHAARFNRRHGRSGALWDGRFRAAIVEPGVVELAALRLIDGGAALGDTGAELARTSAEHRLGAGRDPALTDPAGYWQLGNTPFEREARWRELLAEPVPADLRQRLRRALAGGWGCGSQEFLAKLAEHAQRPATPRPRGRPRRSGG